MPRKKNKNGVCEMAKLGVRMGAYLPVDSAVHRLDARAKILAMLLFLTGIFAVNRLWVFLPVYAVGLAAMAAARIPLGEALRAVRGIVLLLALSCLMNMFLTAGENVLWAAGPLRLTEEGVYKSALLLVRLVALVCFAGWLSYTTTPLDLADGVERLLSPFKRLGFPVHEFAMMMSISLRFIPLLMDEFGRIVKAQKSRGGDFTDGPLWDRVRGLVAVAVPLLYNALKRADDLAVAMEARAYIGGEGRVSLREPKWRLCDSCAVALALLLWVLMMMSRGFGGI